MREAPATANLEGESLSAGRISVRSVSSGTSGKTTEAAAAQMANAHVLEFLSAEQGAGGRLNERRKT